MSLELVKYIHNQLSEAEIKNFELKLKNDSQLQLKLDEYKTKIDLNDELFFQKIEGQKKEEVKIVKVSFWQNPSFKMVATLSLVFLGVGLFTSKSTNNEEISVKGIVNESIQDSRVSLKESSTLNNSEGKIKLEVINNIENTNLVLIIQNKDKSLSINKNPLLLKSNWSEVLELSGRDFANSEKLYVGFTTQSTTTTPELLDCFKNKTKCEISFKEYIVDDIK